MVRSEPAARWARPRKVTAMTALQQTADRATTRPSAAGNLLVRVLMWPVAALLISGGVHFLLEAALPDLHTTYVPAVLGPLLLAYGAWVGFRTISMGGGFAAAVTAGAVLGLLPLMLNIVGFGVILGRGTTAGV